MTPIFCDAGELWEAHGAPCCSGCNYGLPVVIQINEPDPERPTTRRDLCLAGAHRWAYLTSGGQACGYCGVPR